MLPSPFGGRLGPRGYSFSRPQCVHCCYGPVTRNLPSGGLVDRLRRFCFHLLRYPNYGALTSTPAGLSPAEHASLHWTHNHTVRLSPRCPAIASCAWRNPTTFGLSVHQSEGAPKRMSYALHCRGTGGHVSQEQSPRWQRNRRSRRV